MSPVASTPTGTTGALIRRNGMVGLIDTADIRVADRDRLGGDAAVARPRWADRLGWAAGGWVARADRGAGMDLGGRWRARAAKLI
jgi:hypothetical protein